MQKHRQLTLQRLAKFKEYLQSLWYEDKHNLDLQVFAAPDRIAYDEAVTAHYEPIQLGTRLEPLWSTHWFKIDVDIPSDWAGKEVHLRWDSYSEACIWKDGEPLRGLSGSGNYWGSPYHDSYLLTKNAAPDESHHFYIEVAVNTPFGSSGDAYLNHLGLLHLAEIASFRRDYWDFYWDFVTIADMAKHLPETSPRAGQALTTANEMLNLFRENDTNAIQTAQKLAAEFLSQHNGDSQHSIYAIGHAHIDTAWLWPLAETKRKCVRSFSTAVHLMEQYPDYKFVCSQAQQLAWIKELQPQLYERIRQKVETGQFIPVGGAWVEPDCNIPSGESLVRQFLYGQRFYQQEFGRMHTEFWLPDTFGYASALPQIMQGVGIEHFLTQKLSWNQFNKLPANTFYWEGLDGSRVLTHFPPADTYNGLGNIEEILRGTNNFRDHERSNASMYVFGFGDGGGGPSAKMLEQLTRIEDVDGLPKLKLESPQAFFEDCEANAKYLTTWAGELYFELHRGTYTTQALVKWGNRRSERLMHDVEFLYALQADYPQSEIERLWKIILLNQFHDILPGSSITEVYEDAHRDHQEVIESAENFREAALNNLFEGAGQEELTVINTLSFVRREVIELASPLANAQQSSEGNSLIIVDAPAMGYRQQKPQIEPDHAVSIRESNDSFLLENQYLRAVITKIGRVTSLFDKRLNKESIKGAANQFVLYDDHPVAWDAWDIDVFAFEKPQFIADASHVEIIENGALRISLKFDYALANASTISQIISLNASSNWLEFITDLDWHEKHRLLKVEFPLNVHTMTATYETQFGVIQRPTHYNTSWDLARFEVCGHRWAALMEYGFGVALLNDCKYGYSAYKNKLSLSLLRAPEWPDKDADMGKHHFRYALMPFDGQIEKAVQAGLAFNTPLLTHTGHNALPEQSFFSVDSSHVLIDTVKKAEDSDAIILRLYEACGGRGTVHLQTSLNVEHVSRCNLLEIEEQELTIHDGLIELDIRPFQIVTLKMELRK